MRTAEAAGAAGLVTTAGSAHLFSPKGLRGAMGSTLRLPSLEHQSVEDILSEIHKASYFLAAATMSSREHGSDAYSRVDWKKPCAILLGQEGRGISAEWRTHIQQWTHVPMRSSVESLNVAAAAAVFLYESARQRNTFE
jgi:TrmH family RNA methyltransferase